MVPTKPAGRFVDSRRFRSAATSEVAAGSPEGVVAGQAALWLRRPRGGSVPKGTHSLSVLTSECRVGRRSQGGGRCGGVGCVSARRSGSAHFWGFRERRDRTRVDAWTGLTALPASAGWTAGFPNRVRPSSAACSRGRPGIGPMAAPLASTSPADASATGFPISSPCVSFLTCLCPEIEPGPALAVKQGPPESAFWLHHLFSGASFTRLLQQQGFVAARAREARPGCGAVL